MKLFLPPKNNTGSVSVVDSTKVIFRITYNTDPTSSASMAFK
jgi:hypothetical protein